MAAEEASWAWMSIWLIMAPIYVTVDILLRNKIVPWFLEVYRRSSYYQKGDEVVEKSLPGYINALFTKKYIIYVHSNSHLACTGSSVARLHSILCPQRPEV